MLIPVAILGFLALVLMAVGAGCGWHSLEMPIGRPRRAMQGFCGLFLVAGLCLLLVACLATISIVLHP